ncbi:metal ABC transporter ATP-binding protein [Actinotignum urinale]|uniref:metal ABC transporter ATP-binding protein n=1 Tax=Actinotignum urinale TaxID=190146 RepID=UPI00280A6EB9|nr:metal ABC transporter ATP-binding protein [Actinotignum urinale]
MKDALTTSNLTASYRDKVAVSGASIRCPIGEVMAIVGPNGAGKSTLIKAALGLVPNRSGQSLFFGESLDALRKRVGYMSQAAEVDWDFPATVYDVVLMGTYGRRGWFKHPNKQDNKDALAALHTVGISDLSRRQISELSGGQKQRTFVARIIAQNPDLFLMDEPFAGVDVASEQIIREVLGKLREQGKTIIIVHHDLGTVKDFCTWATVMSDGKICSNGPIDSAFTPDIISDAYGISMMNSGE